MLMLATAAWRLLALPHRTGRCPLPLQLALALWLAATTLAAHGQAQPDAGSLRQQLEQALPALPQRAPALDTRAEPTLRLPEGMTVTVQAFRLEGHSLLPEAPLQALLHGYLGRPLGFIELQQAAQAVAQAFRDAGWVARALLPPQDITEGVVTIRIIEARLGAVRLEGPPPLRIGAQRLLDQVQARQRVGDKLNAHRLDEALLLADDLPGVAVGGALEPGQADGDSVLALRTSDEPAAQGELSLDNSGARSTGAARLQAQGQLNSPFKRGDLLRGQAMLSAGSRYARLGYDWPLGLLGTRLDVHASVLNYRLVGADFKALDSRGQSLGAGVSVNHPWLRSRNQNVYVQLSLDHKRDNNRANGSTQSQHRSDGLVLGVNGNRFDDWQGGGASTAHLALHLGQVRLGRLDPGEDLARGGHYKKLRAQLVRRQALSRTLTLVASVRGQYAGKPLDSSERLYLGGADGVRAYPNNEGGGSQGHLASVELRWAPAAPLALAVFADAGQVREPSAAATASASRLQGLGATVSWTGPRGLSARLTLARRVGSNPNPTPTGRDQDGSLVRHRAWAQLSLPF